MSPCGVSGCAGHHCEPCSQTARSGHTSERVYTPLSVSRIGCPRGPIRAEPGPAVSQGTPLSTQKLLSSSVLLAPGGEQCLGWLTPLVTRGPHAFHGRAQHPRVGGRAPQLVRTKPSSQGGEDSDPGLASVQNFLELRAASGRGLGGTGSPCLCGSELHWLRGEGASLTCTPP